MHKLLGLELRSPKLDLCCKYFSLFCERRAFPYKSCGKHHILCDVDLCCTNQMLQPRSFLSIDKRHTAMRILENLTNIWKPIVNNLIENQLQPYPSSVNHSQPISSYRIGGQRKLCISWESGWITKWRGHSLLLPRLIDYYPISAAENAQSMDIWTFYSTAGETPGTSRGDATRKYQGIEPPLFIAYSFLCNMVSVEHARTLVWISCATSEHYLCFAKLGLFGGCVSPR